MAFSAGCAAQNAQLTKCQAEKEQLLTTIRGQRDTTRALHEQVASLETRLDQSEKELARTGTGTRISSRPSETPPRPAPPQSAPPLAAPAIKSESLPWRSPAGKAEPVAPSSDNRRTGSTYSAPSGTSLLALARRDRRVQYDAAAHAARVDLAVGFDDKSATLTAEGKRQLDDLARLLKSDDARELRVMVAGFAAGRPANTGAKESDERFASARQLGTARAQAVADYLDRHGIAQERLGVSGTGARVAASGGDADKLAAGSGVQIYLLDSDAPVVGWGPNPALRR
ncbi:MAG TPA: OmpA family protein [Pirellulaceae bacterium]|nr:OmpA family protein [Pirellulaceae bacterium]